MRLMDYLMSWRFWVPLGSFGALAVYSTWLYSIVLSDRRDDRLHFAKVVGEIRADIQYLADCLGIDMTWEEPNPVEDDTPTEELPVVKPTPFPRSQPEGPATDIAHPVDTFARKEALLAQNQRAGRHRREP